MKNLRDNWNKPNDVAIIYNKKTKKMGKWQPSYKVCENELGQKKDHPKDPPDKY
jgi:hypothetical protein